MKNYTLEDIEWTQYWSEESESGKHKVLLIGDSISVGYRSEVNRLLDDDVSVAAYSTSKAVDNPWFAAELEMNVRQHDFKYDIVTLNNGLHGFHLSLEGYEAGMRALIAKVQSLLPQAKLYLVLSTPVTEYQKPEVLAEKNRIALERNETVRRLAAEFALPVIDLYSVVVGKPELSAGDGYHYNSKGYHALAEAIVGAIR